MQYKSLVTVINAQENMYIASWTMI